jgi:L-histidine N-alpha-methyltransferase
MARRRRADSPEKALLPEPAAPTTAALVSLDAEEAALAEVRASLRGSPREIACKYFYDDRGSALFEQITTLPEYYPTRTERALLDASAAGLVDPSLSDVVELGSGAASKTIALLTQALKIGAQPRYVAVDISAHALERTREIIAAARPEIRVVSVLADYSQNLKLPEKPANGHRLVLFLGGTIGNDEDESAIRLLSRVREHLEPGDALLLGASLVTEPAVIHAAYNDSQGVTAEFNRNILRSLNALAGSRFVPEDFDHHAPYVVEHQRIEMWLVARRRLEIDLGRIGGVLRLEHGEGIRTEISRRFTREGILRLMDAAGFAPARWLESPDGRFGLALGKARAQVRGLL